MPSKLNPGAHLCSLHLLLAVLDSGPAAVTTPGSEASERWSFKTKLSLTNPTGLHIAFKVKTTKPTRYHVKPSQGVIESHSIAEVLST